MNKGKESKSVKKPVVKNPKSPWRSGFKVAPKDAFRRDRDNPR